MSSGTPKESLLAAGVVLFDAGGTDDLRRALKAVRVHLSAAASQLNAGADKDRETLKYIFAAEALSAEIERLCFRLECDIAKAHRIVGHTLG